MLANRYRYSVPNGSNHQLKLIAGENRRYSPENPVMDFLVTLFDGSSAPVNCVKGGATMPNIKSAMKRDAKSKELRAKNRADKTALKTVMKKFDAAVAGGDKTAAAESYKVAVKAVDKAACKGLIHKNNAAHKKSAMTVALNKMD